MKVKQHCDLSQVGWVTAWEHQLLMFFGEFYGYKRLLYANIFFSLSLLIQAGHPTISPGFV
jgi:hypothetical protein